MMQNVFIIGARGNVGRTLVRQIFEKGDTNTELHKNPTRIVGLGSIDGYIWSRQGILQDNCYDFISKKDGSDRYSFLELTELAKVNTSENYGLTFIDVTAAKEPMRDFHLRVVDETTCGIVTSNKNPVTMVDSATFARLAKHTQRYGFRCSVMAGANAIDEIMDFRDLGDRVRSIEGCFSGTLGYICSELQAGRAFSEIVAEAKKEGYTEPHPADDLSGRDVAKKILILARTSGLEIDLQDVKVIPFIPSEYLDKQELSEFMNSLPMLDNYFSELIANARRQNSVLRYVASMFLDKQGKAYLRVEPKLVSSDSALGTLKGTLNKIVITTDTYASEKPCIIEAPGAGLEVTAQNVRRDLLKQIQNRTVNFVR